MRFLKNGPSSRQVDQSQRFFRRFVQFRRLPSRLTSLSLSLSLSLLYPLSLCIWGTAQTSTHTTHTGESTHATHTAAESVPRTQVWHLQLVRSTYVSNIPRCNLLHSRENLAKNMVEIYSISLKSEIFLHTLYVVQRVWGTGRESTFCDTPDKDAAVSIRLRMTKIYTLYK